MISRKFAVMYTSSFDLNELILSVSEGLISELLCIHNEGMGTFDLHVLILCVSEGLHSELPPCTYNEGMGSFDLHVLILCVS